MYCLKWQWSAHSNHRKWTFQENSFSVAREVLRIHTGCRHPAIHIQQIPNDCALRFWQKGSWRPRPAWLGRSWGLVLVVLIDYLIPTILILTCCLLERALLAILWVLKFAPMRHKRARFAPTIAGFLIFWFWRVIGHLFRRGEGSPEWRPPAWMQLKEESATCWQDNQMSGTFA